MSQYSFCEATEVSEIPQESGIEIEVDLCACVVMRFKLLVPIAPSYTKIISDSSTTSLHVHVISLYQIDKKYIDQPV